MNVSHDLTSVELKYFFLFILFYTQSFDLTGVPKRHDSIGMWFDLMGKTKVSIINTHK